MSADCNRRKPLHLPIFSFLSFSSLMRRWEISDFDGFCFEVANPPKQGDKWRIAPNTFC
jgi:hypothetical protein